MASVCQRTRRVRGGAWVDRLDGLEAEVTRTDPRFLVYFDERSALVVAAADERDARLVAQLQAWALTGLWLDVVRVEAEAA